MGFKHSTASVFVLGQVAGRWRLGLVWHPQFRRWMLPGGHVEDLESPAEAAVREVREEAGLDVELATAPGPAITDGVPVTVCRPLWLVEHEAPAEHRLPQSHVHMDHLYLAVARKVLPRADPDHQFAWYAQSDLAGLRMFDTSRRLASAVLDSVDALALPAIEVS